MSPGLKLSSPQSVPRRKPESLGSGHGFGRRTLRLLGSGREPERRQPRRWKPRMGIQAEAASPKADAAMRWPRGAGLQPESVGGLISTPQPRGLANLARTATEVAFTRQAEAAVRPIDELAAIPRRERGKRRRRGSEGLIASCWPKRTGIVKGKNESRGELDGDGKHGFRPAGEDRSCWKRPTGRFIRLTVSPEPEQESPARGHASEDGGNRFGKGLQRAVGRDEQAGSNLGIWCFWVVPLSS